jgi:hypothetical protein
MPNAANVLEMLRPNAIWYMDGQDYEGITFIDCEPLSKEEFEAGFAQYDAFKAQQDEAKAAARNVVLERLGLTAEEMAENEKLWREENVDEDTELSANAELRGAGVTAGGMNSDLSGLSGATAPPAPPTDAGAPDAGAAPAGTPPAA